MPFCVNCGNLIDDRSRFCSSCGSAVKGTDLLSPTTGKTDSVRKCPSCGGVIPAMTGICPFCNNEFSNTPVAASVHAFFEKLDALDQQAFEENAKKDAKGPLGGALGAALGLDNMVKLYSGLSAGDKRKIEMINNFPVPNNKEDILEFIILACSRVNKKPRMLGNPNWLIEKRDIEKYNNAWTTKIKQVYMKAQIAFKSDRELLQKIERIIKDTKIKL